mgnify:CR=1 FL=1
MNASSFISIILFQIIIASVNLNAQPRWTSNRPVQKGYYIGIGFAEKNHADYSSHAREKALKEIASQISVTLEGQTRQHIIEQAGIVNKRFESNLKILVNEELQDYELVDSWDSEKEYWVYYRLSKARHAQIMEQKMRTASNHAFQYFTEAKKSIKNKDYTDALGFYLKAASAIGEFRGMGLQFPGKEKRTYIDVEVFVALQKHLSRLTLISKPMSISTSLFEPPEPVTLQINYINAKGKSEPVSKMPLKAEFLKGKVNYKPLTSTNEQGKSTLRINPIRKPGDKQIKISPELDILSANPTDSLIFDGLNLPSCMVNVSTKAVSAVVKAKIQNIGEKPMTPFVADNIKQHLTEKGWSIYDDPENAEFMIKISGSTEKGSERSGIHTAFASGSITLIRNETNEELLTKSVERINGGGLSFEAAGKKALQNLGDQLYDKFREAME